jgi:rhamnogalacturonyl hydrolase YesR
LHLASPRFGMRAVILYPGNGSIVPAGELRLVVAYPGDWRSLRVNLDDVTRRDVEWLPLGEQRAVCTLPLGRRCDRHVVRVATSSLGFSSEPCSPQALGESVARHKELAAPPARLGCAWPAALWLYGLVQFATLSGRAERHLDYVRDALGFATSRRDFRITSPDEAALALSAVELGRLHGDRGGQLAIEAALEFFRNEPRNAFGALSHVGYRHRFHAWLPLTRRYTAAAIWVDSLVMYALTAARIGRVSGDHELERFGYRQPALFAERLQCTDGLFKHAHYLGTGRTVPRGRTSWLRGHAWAMIAMVDMLEHMPEKDPERPGIARILGRAAHGLVALRLPGWGLWPSLLTRRALGSEPEVSGSLLAAYAMAKGHRLGVLPGRFLALAAEVLRDACGFLCWQGFDRYGVTGISGPTNPSAFEWCYGPPLVRPTPDAGYGVAGFLLLARELALARFRFD